MASVAQAADVNIRVGDQDGEQANHDMALRNADAKNRKAHAEPTVYVGFDEGDEKFHHYIKAQIAARKLALLVGSGQKALNDIHQLKRGDRVYHADRGAGTVMSVMTRGEMTQHMWSYVRQRHNKLVTGDYLEVTALGDAHAGELGRVVRLVGADGADGVELKLRTGDDAGLRVQYSRDDVKHLPN